MQIKPIKTEQDYEDALRAVEPMFDDELLLIPRRETFSKSCVC
jgi:HTH-type transcriptional regulator/antitoxin HigA